LLEKPPLERVTALDMCKFTDKCVSLIFASLSFKEARCEQMNWHIQGHYANLRPAFLCELVRGKLEMHWPLPLEFTETARKRSLVERVCRLSMGVLLTFRADCSLFTSKPAHSSRLLPTDEQRSW
jgi:hypothetical protein